MIPIHNGKVNARELHSVLDSKKAFSTWFAKKVKSAYLEEGKDFLPMWEESNGGRRSTNYELTLEAAKNICLVQNTIDGRKLRDYLIAQDNKVQNNELLSLPKTALLIKILNTFKFADYQIEAEDMHKNKFILSARTKENIHKLFAEHRNDILGIDNEQLKKDLLEAYKNGLIHTAKANNIRGRITLLDKYTLIRNAVVDYLLSVGTNTHDAITFAETAKKIAEMTNLEIRIKDEENLFEHKQNVMTPTMLALQGVKLITE